MTYRFRPLLLPAVSMTVLIGFTSSIPKDASSPVRSGSKANVELAGSTDKFAGMCYSPYRDNEDPNSGIHPTVDELSEDLTLIENLTHSIRTYGVTDNLEQIPVLCQQHGIDCYPGAWISRYECENERQISGLIQVANLNFSHVQGLIIGNEVILRNDIPVNKLIEFIDRVKDSTNSLPVATAETWFDWLEHPQLAQAVDILLVHIYAYWDGIAIENGAAYTLEKWNEVKARYPDKTIVIGETGWPSQGEIRGDAVPSEENQRKYLSDFVAMADSNNIDYFFFEIFDEKWKSEQGEGEVGSHWGLYHSDGSLKPLLMDLIPEQAQEGIDRPAGEVDTTEATLPLYVYTEGCDSLNGFYPSGWMGELEQYVVDSASGDPTEILYELSAENPYSGETCIRISYTPSPGQWGGIYWQFPVNNWGVYPGYDLSESIGGYNSVKLRFHVRGENGGEKAEFKTGGIYDPDLEYRDSYGPISTGVITLKKEWEEYSLDLTGQDLRMVIGGFVWVTNYGQNPLGATIYLDEIAFETQTDVFEEGNTIPTGYHLSQNYPNPFNSSTMISYELEQRAEVDISVYNIEGRKLVTLVSQGQQLGTHYVKWNGCDRKGKAASSGIYIYRLTINGTSVDSKKMTLVK